MSLQIMVGHNNNKFFLLWVCIGFFSLAVLYRYVFIVFQNAPDKIAIAIEQRLQTEVNHADFQVGQLREIIEKTDTPVFGDFFIKSYYPYYIFQNKRILFWSDNSMVPMPRDIIGDFTVSFIQTGRGDFVCRKETISRENQVYEVVVFIPLVEKFKVVNQFLQHTVNRRIFTDSNFELSPTKTDDEFVSINLMDTNVFFIKIGNTYSNAGSVHSMVMALFFLISGISLVLYLIRQSREITRDHSVGSGLLFLSSALVALRSLMLLTGFPSDLVYTELFDPRFYASSLINPSLGDLILNVGSLLGIGLFVFSNYLKPAFMKKIMAKGAKTKLTLAIIACFFTFFWLAMHHQIMRTLNFDSRWSMDLGHSLTLDGLKLISYQVFFLSIAVYLLFSHVCFRILEKTVSGKKRLFFLSLFIGTLLFLGLGWMFNIDVLVVAAVNLAFILIVRYYRLYRSLGKVEYLTFIYLFSFGVPGAVVGVYANYQFRQSRAEYNKSRLANQLLVERDFFTELQLSEVVNAIKEDGFITQRIISPYASKVIIEKKIRNEYLNNLDKFDIGVYVFNSRGEPFEQFNIKDNFHDYKAKLSSFKTETEGLYFVNLARGQATSRYVVFINIEERGQMVGYILLDLRQKRFVPNSVFPLLSNESSYNLPADVAGDYSYAVFVNNQLKYNSGAFDYRNHMIALAGYAPELFERSVVLSGFNHRAYQGEGSRFVIVSAKESTLGQRVANFSFLFLIYIFTILIILISLTVYQRLRHITLNYATKIQLYLNFAFFTPLIIVSLTTVSIIVQTFKTSLDHQYLELADNLANRISGPLNEYRSLTIETEELADEVSRMAEVADLDINIFHTNGRLITSSLMQVYQNEMLSENIDPTAYVGITEDLSSAFVLEEKVGSLNYKSAYVAIRSFDTGTIIGILGLPFFESQTDLDRRIIDVLSNIINIFTLLFIFFLLISFFISRGLTFPLRLITQKIKRTTLSSFNEPLSWNSDDEIGMMVTEYNRMLVNLEESKKALAKSEKESAWREMARQVAHEIKNPLTPMKLSLQHMQRTLIESRENEEKEKKMQQIQSLLEQIETLNDIATSFSDFARMPSPSIEKVELRALLKEIIELYSKSDEGVISADIQAGEFYVEGDRKWLGRAFSNLIINAFQAAGDSARAKIDIKMHRSGSDLIRIEIKDNGSGIPDHIKEKVFSPNFSTKYTGSGLGLAITKKGIEHANGKIWFESEEGSGTTFFIEITRI